MNDSSTTNQNPNGPPVEMVKYDDAVRYLGAMGILAACPACGHDQAGILTGPDAVTVRCLYWRGANFHSDFSVSDNLPGIGIWIVDCSKCGNIRNFGYGRLVDWVRNNPARTSNE